MSDQTTYSDGDIVWVKLGSCWWPGEVWGLEKLPPGILKSFRKTPIAVVKFFQEDTFEYVKNTNFIFKYNCSRKNDFIKKGLDLFRSKHTHMDKFPEDVCTAERLTNGDPDIITSKEFLPQKKESYANIFGTPTDTTAKRNSLGKRGRPPSGSPGKSRNISPAKITHPRLIQKYFKGSSDYKAHILVQPSISPGSPTSPSVTESPNASCDTIDKTPKATPDPVKFSPAQSSEMYSCHVCNFTATRLNVIILHNKSHSSGAIQYTPIKTPKPKSPALKVKPKSVTIVEDEFEAASTSKKRKVTMKGEGRTRGRPRNILENVSPDPSSSSQSKDKTNASPPKRKLNKQKERESKKAKTDVEIKNSLLADWNEDSEDDSMDVLSSLKLSQNVSESSEESKTAQKDDITAKTQSDSDNKSPLKISTNEKSEKRDQASCFDFEEEDDLQIENIGKKIPRLSSKSDEFPKKVIDTNISDANAAVDATTDKNASSIENNNSRMNPDIDFDSEIDNLLNETTVPELPPLPSHSNFQKSQPVKVPDKEKPGDTHLGKSIFKTKTFFRSRHSRSQDAIEKYVADNTSTDKPPTYMNEPVESERSSDIASESLSDNSSLSQDNDILPVPPKTETVRVTKYAPKIQLKKLNAALVNKSKTLSQDPNEKKQEDINNIQSDVTEKSENESDAPRLAEGVNENSTDQKKSVADDVIPSDQPESESTKNCDQEIINSKDSSVPSDTQLSTEPIKSPVPTINVLNDKISAAEKEQVAEQKLNDNSKILDIPATVVENPKCTDEPVKTLESNVSNPSVDSSVKLFSITDDDNISPITDENISLIHKSDNTENDDSSKLFRMLDESNIQKVKSPLKIISTKIIKPQGREKILNFDVGGSQSKQSSNLSQNQKIIIRRTTNPLKSRENSQESLILCNKNAEKWNDDDVQTFTIEEPSSANDDLLDPKLTKVSRSFSAKPHNTIITSTGEIIQSDKAKKEDTIFDISSMPIVLSDEIVSANSAPKSGTIIKKSIQSEVKKSTLSIKSDAPAEKPTMVRKYIESPIKKSIIVKSVIEKTVSPNILSKSGKGKSMKHLLVVDKNTGEKKIIKAGDLNDDVKEHTQSEGRSVHQSGEKIIINSKFPGGKKTQKVIITPTTKSQVVVGRLGETGEPEMFIAANPSTIPKNVTKVVQNNPSIDQSTGNAIMILTNSQGVQSKILLTPEQQLLFPKGKMHSVSQTSGTPSKNKSQSIVISSAQILYTESSTASAGGKPQTPPQTVRTMAKQKGTILNSKGQIVMAASGSKRTILTTMPGQAILTSKGQLIAPQSSIITSSSKGVLNTNKTLTTASSSNLITKTVTHPKVIGKPRTEVIAQVKPEKSISNAASSVLLKSQNKTVNQNIIQAQLKESIFSSQKPGTVMHLTAAQFEHLQKTGQLISTQRGVNSSQNKTTTGKVTQKFILQKIINPKQMDMQELIADGKKSNIVGQHRLENVFSNDVPPLAPIHSDQSLKKQRLKEQTKKFVPEPAINPIPDCTLSDADDLIPATIIPTRKHEMLQKKQNDQLNLDAQRKGEAMSNILPEPVKQVDANITDETQMSTNALNDPQKQLLAIPGENFGGPPNSFFLCVEENGALTPIDNQPLVLEDNQLVPMVVSTAETSGSVILSSSKDQSQTEQQILDIPADQAQQNILLNIGDQQILIDHQTLLTLLAGEGQQLVTNDGQQLVFQGNSQQILSALANNPELAGLLGGGQQMLMNPSGTNMTPQAVENTSASEGFSYSADVQPNVNQDILAAALAGTEVFQQDPIMSESLDIPATDTERMMMDIDALSSNLQNINPVQTVHSNVFETSSTLNQPIMSPLEIPTKKRCDEKTAELLAITKNSSISKNLDDSLAVIGVTTPNVPTSLDLPITVTNPRIAAKTTSPLSLTNSGVYQSSSLLNNSLVSSGIGIYEAEKSHSTMSNINLSDLRYDSNNLTTECNENNLPIASSMPCLDDSSSESFVETSTIKPEVETKVYSPISMPILTDDIVDVPITSESSEVTEINEQPSVVECETNASMPNISKSPDPTLETAPLSENYAEKAVIETLMDIADDNSQNTIENECIAAENVNDIEKICEDPIENPSELSVDTNGIADEEQSLNTSIEQVVDEEKSKEESCPISEVDISTPIDDDKSQSNEFEIEKTSDDISPLINNTGSNSVMEPDEMCADTPPNMLDHDSAAMYEPEASIVHNEPDGNSLPDHMQEELYISCSSESAALPDSTSPNLDVSSPTLGSRDDDDGDFSDSSSDSSTEIPIQPLISVSHSVVQNFSSMLNNPDSDEKTHENNVVDMNEQFEENKKSSPKNKIINER